MRQSRIAVLAGGTALAALLSACGTSPTVVNAYPAAPVSYPTTAVQTVPVPVPVQTMGAEYGRVADIQFFPGGTARSGVNVPGAIVGAVAGAVLGNQIGGGSGRDAATVLGGAAGAAVGSQVGRSTSVSEPVYRITVQTDTGLVRYLDVPASGDLRVGDRVRIENGVIYRA